jgi:DNA-binding NarL/FixJ family response regulator
MSKGGDAADRLIRVMIADDDPLARGVLRTALATEGIQIVAETGSALEAAQLAPRERPDVTLIDPALGPGDGMTAVRSLLAAWPDGHVLVLSNTEDPELALRSLRAGASGFLTREIDPAVLPVLVRAIVNGETAISRKLTTAVIARLRELPDGPLGLRPVKSPLTSREWEVLDLLCLGQSTEMIARELVVTSETARSHIKNILRKLGVKSRAEAVAAAEKLRRASEPSG